MTGKINKTNFDLQRILFGTCKCSLLLLNNKKDKRKQFLLLKIKRRLNSFFNKN